MNRPIATIISGLPLSGKTTFLAALYQNGVVTSKKVLIEELPDAIEEKKGFALEMDISSVIGHNLIQRLKSAGYYIIIHVLHVDSMEITAVRLAHRVHYGGEDSIMKNVIRGYQGSCNWMLWAKWSRDDKRSDISMVDYADELYYYQNSEKNHNPRLLIAYRNGIKAFSDEELISQSNRSLSIDIKTSHRIDIQSDEIIDATREKIDASLERSFKRLIRYGPLYTEEIARPHEIKEDTLIAYLISTTNHGLAHYSNIIGRLHVTTIARWVGDGRDETFHTSALRGYELAGKKLILYTLNSTYTFEIIAGEFDTFAFTQANQEMIEEYARRNNTRFDAYWCQIASGFSMIDRTITIATLPYPMTLHEARDYLLDNMLTDSEGNIVYNIMQAYEPKDKL